jgi:hypothetical protein
MTMTDEHVSNMGIIDFALSIIVTTALLAVMLWMVAWWWEWR